MKVDFYRVKMDAFNGHCTGCERFTRCKYVELLKGLALPYIKYHIAFECNFAEAVLEWKEARG